jgi:hypothetical protein
VQAAAAAPEVGKKVFFDITIGGEPAGRITFGLYGAEGMRPLTSVRMC